MEKEILQLIIELQSVYKEVSLNSNWAQDASEACCDALSEADDKGCPEGLVNDLIQSTYDLNSELYKLEKVIEKIVKLAIKTDNN